MYITKLGLPALNITVGNTACDYKWNALEEV